MCSRIQNAILVDKNINKVGEIKIEDGKIVEIGENLSFDDSYEIIDAKVITIPTDRTYQQGFRAEKREEPEADSEYMSRQAENALKKLRAIGG